MLISSICWGVLLWTCFWINLAFKSALSCVLQEDMTMVEGPTDEVPPTVDEASSVMDDFQERRAQAIAAKAREIEKV